MIGNLKGFWKERNDTFKVQKTSVMRSHFILSEISWKHAFYKKTNEIIWHQTEIKLSMTECRIEKRSRDRPWVGWNKGII